MKEIVDFFDIIRLQNMQELSARTMLMPTHYCSLHARLLRARKNEWMDFPREKIEGIKSLYRLFQRRAIDTPEYLVIETACDRCDVQTFQEKLRQSASP
jgi:hypothetical protein